MINHRSLSPVWCGVLSTMAVLSITATVDAATFIRFDTVLGTVDVELFDTQTPLTVENFLHYVDDEHYNYVNDDEDYVNSLIHRSATDFVIQGGGWLLLQADPLNLKPVESDPPVTNEPGISNTRGTIAMAKLGGDPNSATTQWFFNLTDNSFLDSSNGGFTVFGQVIGDGMNVVDAIADLPTFPFSSPFSEIPLRDYTTDDFTNSVPVVGDNLVVINSVTRLTLAGDANGDGQVTGLDLIEVQQNFGQSQGSDPGQLTGDANGDGQVTGLDLIEVQQNFGQSLAAPTIAAIPEPATLALIGLGGLMLVRRRRA